MIGQQHLLEVIKGQVANQTYPRFAIFCGERGSEQIDLCSEISKLLHANMIVFSNSVDDVREMINMSYANQGDLYLYVLFNADAMSNNARNALLKIAEEPPKNAYIVMLLEDLNNTLETIRSRGTSYNLESYSVPQLEIYCKSKDYLVPNEILSVCSTPGELDLITKQDMKAFVQFAKKTFENIHVVQGANAFKIAQSINLADDESKYDLKLFWKLFIYFCYSHIERAGYPEAIKITLQNLRQLRINGINKQMLFDLWILDIRECWLYADH